MEFCKMNIPKLTAKGKVKVTLEQTAKIQRGVEV
jgi:hypothetical protein